MNTRSEIMWYYYFIANSLTFLLFFIDKQQAIRGKWRLSEKVLLASSFAGGAVGAALGMKVFRHKTRKTLFKVLIPLSIVLHIYLMASIKNYL